MAHGSIDQGNEQEKPGVCGEIPMAAADNGKEHLNQINALCGSGTQPQGQQGENDVVKRHLQP